MTPGAILTEIMAQIGLVVLGIYLLAEPPEARERADDPAVPIFPLLTSVGCILSKMVLPGQKVTVISNKVYFRFGKLKCKVVMQDAEGEEIAKGTFAGMIKDR